jgi:hypothetical protein
LWCKQNVVVNEGQVRIRHIKPEIYRWLCSWKKVWNTVRVISYQFYLYINVISVLCNPNGTLFQTCLIVHVWLKSIILVLANILNTFFSFFPIVFISKHALHNWFYTLIENWCHNTQSVRNKVIHKYYVFSVTSESRTFRFGRNKELFFDKQTKTIL